MLRGSYIAYFDLKWVEPVKLHGKCAKLRKSSSSSKCKVFINLHKMLYLSFVFCYCGFTVKKQTFP